MNRAQSLVLTSLGSPKKGIQDDNSTPSIVRNIEKMAEKYQKFIDSEISEEQANQSDQADKVKKLKENALKRRGSKEAK